MHKSLPGIEGREGNSGRINSMAKRGCTEFWNSEFRYTVNGEGVREQS